MFYPNWKSSHNRWGEQTFAFNEQTLLPSLSFSTFFYRPWAKWEKFLNGLEFPLVSSFSLRWWHIFFTLCFPFIPIYHSAVMIVIILLLHSTRHGKVSPVVECWYTNVKTGFRDSFVKRKLKDRLEKLTG